MTKPSRAPVLLILILSLSAWGDARETIVKNVNAIASPGLPGTLCVLGDGAFTIADAPTATGAGTQAAVVAAARPSGKTTGGVVLFGHDGYFDPAALAKADTTPLLLNLIAWAAAGKDKPRVGVIDLPQLADYLKTKGVDASPLPRGGQWAAKLADYAVVFFPPNIPKDDADAAAIKRYLDGGGAAFFAVTGWGWLSTHAGHTLAEHPTNRLLAAAGIALAAGDGTIERDRKTPRGAGAIAITREPPPSPMLNAKAALDLLIASAAAKPAGAQPSNDKKVELAQAAQTLLFACRALPAESPLMKRLHAIAAQRTDLPLPSPAKPLRQADGLSRVLLTLKLLEAGQTPIDQLKANPAAREFPGQVPASAPRVTRTIPVDPRIPRWHSTGLYAAPGEMITVTLPTAAVGRNLRLRIGAHTDHTYKLAAWHRAPEISREFMLDKPETRAASAFGGLIYIEVPDRGAPPPDSEVVQVTIAHAVPAPYFVLGKTTPQQWRDTLRSAPAPWGELATDKLILTIRSDAIRTLDDPTSVLEHWNNVMDATATLAGWPLPRKSPERIVPDADISVGYMHSGYPIMTGLDVIPAMVDLARLKNPSSAWGFYHEIGHNHQNPDWTFPGTTEVTVNLFTMHTLETVCGVSKEDATRRALVEPAARIKKYLAKPDFAAWQADPFLALAMYAQLRMQFGWEPFKKVFADYRALPNDQRPKTEEQKHDQWMLRMSKATGKNLGPFFQAWGIPTSETARKSIAQLPTWMPASMER